MVQNTLGSASNRIPFHKDAVNKWMIYAVCFFALVGGLIVLPLAFVLTNSPLRQYFGWGLGFFVASSLIWSWLSGRYQVVFTDFTVKLAPVVFLFWLAMAFVLGVLDIALLFFALIGAVVIVGPGFFKGSLYYSHSGYTVKNDKLFGYEGLLITPVRNFSVDLKKIENAEVVQDSIDRIFDSYNVLITGKSVEGSVKILLLFDLKRNWGRRKMLFGPFDRNNAFSLMERVLPASSKRHR